MTIPDWSPEEWRRIEAALDRILDLPPWDRLAVIDAEFEEDPRLIKAVRELLSAEDLPGSVLDQDIDSLSVLLLDETDPTSPDSLVGGFAGPFKIVKKLGQGGMGGVYLADRSDGQFDQRVALKVVRAGFESASLRSRFVAERRILAKLDHPNIARLIDGGFLADGRPYFAMEFVDGQTLSEWCEKNQAPLRRRLEMLLSVCEAVAFAHRNLVLHLDLKPANIMVTEQGVPKLLDFGIAAMVQPDSGEGEDSKVGGIPLPEAMAQIRPRALTPEYAAPELVRGDSISTVTDVFALGMVLQDLLADQSVPRELGSVVAKACHRNPLDRYPSVADMASDLQAFLSGFPLSAHPGSPLHRGGKFFRRHRLAASAVAALLMALLGGLSATLWQARIARNEAEKAEKVKDFLVGVFVDADPERSDADVVTTKDLLERGAERVRVELAGQPEIQADMLLTIAQVYRNLGSHAEAIPLVEEVVESRKALFGPRHDAVAEALNERGWLEYLQGAWGEAEGTLREVVKLRRKLRDTEPQDLARSIDNLAEVRRVQADFQEAEALAREALALRRRFLGDHVDIATSLNNLGVIVRQTGAGAEAEPFFREALEIRRRLQGPDHPEAWATQGNLALWLREHGQREEARGILADLLQRQRSRFGEDHPLSLGTLNNLASLHRDLEDLEEAAALFRQVLSLWQARGGARHPNAITSKNNLGAVLREMGELDEAEAHFREVREFFRTELGDNHPNYAVATHNLATTLFRAGRMEEAESLFTQALGTARQLWPEGHPLTATFALGYGRFLETDGRCRDAIPLLQEAISSLSAAAAEIIPGSLAESQLALGSCLSFLGRPRDAEPFLLEAYRGLEGRGNRRRLAAEGLVGVYESLGRRAEAEVWRNRSLVPKSPARDGPESAHSPYEPDSG